MIIVIFLSGIDYLGKGDTFFLIDNIIIYFNQLALFIGRSKGSRKAKYRKIAAQSKKPILTIFINIRWNITPRIAVGIRERRNQKPIVRIYSIKVDEVASMNTGIAKKPKCKYPFERFTRNLGEIIDMPSNTFPLRYSGVVFAIALIP